MNFNGLTKNIESVLQKGITLKIIKNEFWKNGKYFNAEEVVSEIQHQMKIFLRKNYNVKCTKKNLTY